MDFENFFRKFFGTPNPFYRYKFLLHLCNTKVMIYDVTNYYRPEEDRNEQKNDQPTGNHEASNNFHWKTEFQQMDLMMTQLLQEMLRGFPMLNEDRELPTLDAHPYSPASQENPPHQGSLRDQMLKPGKEEMLDKHGWQNPSNQKLNTDFDEAIEKNNLQLLFPQPQNDGLHYSFRLFLFFLINKSCDHIKAVYSFS